MDKGFVCAPPQVHKDIIALQEENKKKGHPGPFGNMTTRLFRWFTLLRQQVIYHCADRAVVSIYIFDRSTSLMTA
jgi:hypothetical protein